MRVLLLAGVLWACPHRSIYQSADEQRDGAALFRERWLGQPEDEVLRHYGRPDDTVNLSNGHRLSSYHRELLVSSSRGFAQASRHGGTAFRRGEAGTVYCDRRFEVDPETATVVEARIGGSNCDFNR